MRNEDPNRGVVRDRVLEMRTKIEPFLVEASDEPDYVRMGRVFFSDEIKQLRYWLDYLLENLDQYLNSEDFAYVLHYQEQVSACVKCFQDLKRKIDALFDFDKNGMLKVSYGLSSPTVASRCGIEGVGHDNPLVSESSSLRTKAGLLIGAVIAVVVGVNLLSRTTDGSSEQQRTVSCSESCVEDPGTNTNHVSKVGDSSSGATSEEGSSRSYGFIRSQVEEEQLQAQSPTPATCYLYIMDEGPEGVDYKLALRLLEDYIATHVRNIRTIDSENSRLALLNGLKFYRRSLPSYPYVISRSTRYGNNPFKIITCGNEGGYVVRLTDVTTRTSQVTVYVPAGHVYEFSIADGTYEVKYLSGAGWFGDKILFGRECAAARADREFVCSGGCGYSITLYKVKNGNLKTSVIDPALF